MTDDDLAQMRSEIRALGHRVELLEGELAKLRQPIPEDDIFVLAAAVAAYLGKRAPIRQIRLLGTTTWSQQGRVSIQASRRLSLER
jgi:methylmalonyl-CoA carboxyltransferase large subunit